MANRKRRLDKKLHKFWLEMGVIDASQKPDWRRRLFEAEEKVPIVIDSENCPGLSLDTVKAIRKYKLQFLAAKVPAQEAESWLSEGGLIVFKFWPLNYPELAIFSGNNPNVI